MAKGFELEGELKIVDEVQTFASGFSKREFIVEVEDGKYPQAIKFECVKERTSLTDGFQPGDAVRVHFDIRGNEYNGRHFVNLSAWKLEKAGASGDRDAAGGSFDEGGSDAGPPSEPPPGHGSDDDDDIPF